jgi:hypothetical protein
MCPREVHRRAEVRWWMHGQCISCCNWFKTGFRKRQLARQNSCEFFRNIQRTAVDSNEHMHTSGLCCFIWLFLHRAFAIHLTTALHEPGHWAIETIKSLYYSFSLYTTRHILGTYPVYAINANCKQADNAGQETNGVQMLFHHGTPAVD